MSHDQRPGKIRVVGNAVATPPAEDAPPPANRASDPTALTLAATGTAAASPRSRISLVAVLLFVLACAAGGALTQSLLLR